MSRPSTVNLAASSHQGGDEDDVSAPAPAHFASAPAHAVAASQAHGECRSVLGSRPKAHRTRHTRLHLLPTSLVITFRRTSVPIPSPPQAQRRGPTTSSSSR